MLSLKDLQINLRKISETYSIGCCNRCNKTGAKFWPAMTAYHWNKEKTDDDPNRDVFLCELCHEEYVEYWTEMWAEYNNSIRC